MPTPNSGENKDDFLSRCIPLVVGEGKKQEQAVAICNSIWENKDKSIGTMITFKVMMERIDAVSDQV